MKRTYKLLLCVFCSLFLLGFGVLIFKECLLSNDNIYITVLIAYLALLYLLSKIGFFQNHILPNIRGWVLSFRTQNHPEHLVVGKNVKIFHPDRISFGRNCDIGEGVVFAPLCYSGGEEFPSEIRIGNNVHFGAEDRIASMKSVIVEDDVLFAAFVHVTDHSHEYRKVGLPIRKQSVYCKGPVVIKKGAWLAFGCHILSGVTVGEYSVVAANSVVTKDVPPYSVVAGNPARLISTYDFETQTWKKINKQEKTNSEKN